jgi:hypothetical protein
LPGIPKNRKHANAMTTTLPADIDPVAELTAAIHFGKNLATTARADLKAAANVLIDALRHGSGQSAKIEKILWSVWNHDHRVNLCDALSGLDCKLAQAAVAMIAARAHMGGAAEDLLREIIERSGSQSPAA